MAQVHSVNPFLSNLKDFDAREALGLEKRDAGPTGYALVQRGPAPSADEIENLSARAVEITVMWGQTILHVTHLSPPRAYFVGESSSKQAKVEYTIPAEKLGATRLPVVSMVDGEPCVIVPDNSSARVTLSGGAPETAAPGTRIPLSLGTRIELAFGDLSIRVSGTHAGKRTQRAYFDDRDSSALGFFGTSLATVAAFVGAMAFFVPPMGITDGEMANNERVYAVQQYLAASAERNRELTEQADPNTEAQQGGGETGEAAKGDSGAMGKATAKLSNERAGVKGPKDNTDPHVARDRALDEARRFGMIGLLDSGPGGDPNAPTAPWGRDTSLGTDDASAQGNMWGDDLGESWGSGGLGLTGVGEGSGGKSNSIGISGIGTCGSSICSGLPGGFARSTSRLGPGHATRAPHVTFEPNTSVSGRLPPEVIQRVVRQNFGRFRMCYEQGLGRNPNLQGRVVARFVIGRDGAVSRVSNGGSDIADSGVVSCVLGAYYGLSFPTPEDGIVTVSYPILFSPG